MTKRSLLLERRKKFSEEDVQKETKLEEISVQVEEVISLFLIFQSVSWMNAEKN